MKWRLPYKYNQKETLLYVLNVINLFKQFEDK